jgi:hypothetical protein
MLQIARQIVSSVKAGQLPENAKDLFADLYDIESNQFLYQESSHWDYKAEFPFSLSDSYFGGILRLICAFHNTFGGIIIFGVHDQARDPGHNKVAVNIERLNNVVRQSLSSPVELIHREYFLGEPGEKEKKIDVILVPQRRMGIAPVRFTKEISPYKVGMLWLRMGHEVIEPSSMDLPKLYASRGDYGVEDDDDVVQIDHALPPSPATLKEFIGRRDALDRLFKWLFADDEPRTFLYGRGGSGKSTIAYEFARMVSESGGRTPTKQGSPIDFVIYVSAKLTAIEPLSRLMIENNTHDFSTAKELYQAILRFIGWTSNVTSIIEADEQTLLTELGELLDTIQPLIVIDDIDTLTTAGRDPGMDALYRIVLRSRAGGKILYTMRNAPTQSLANAIEVPGLDECTELPALIATCCKQFRVPDRRGICAGAAEHNDGTSPACRGGVDWATSHCRKLRSSLRVIPGPGGRPS